MDQSLLIPFLVGWTSIYQLFWCSPGVQGFDTLPNSLAAVACSMVSYHGYLRWRRAPRRWFMAKTIQPCEFSQEILQICCTSRKLIPKQWMVQHQVSNLAGCDSVDTKTTCVCCYICYKLFGFWCFGLAYLHHKRQPTHEVTCERSRVTADWGGSSYSSMFFPDPLWPRRAADMPPYYWRPCCGFGPGSLGQMPSFLEKEGVTIHDILGCYWTCITRDSYWTCITRDSWTCWNG